MSKKTKLKARHMWADPLDLPDDGYSNLRLSRKCAPPSNRVATTPVAVIPLDNPAALLDAATLAATNTARKLVGKPALTRVSDSENPESNRDIISSALAAIGVLPKQRKGRK